MNIRLTSKTQKFTLILITKLEIPKIIMETKASIPGVKSMASIKASGPLHHVPLQQPFLFQRNKGISIIY